MGYNGQMKSCTRRKCSQPTQQSESQFCNSSSVCLSCRKILNRKYESENKEHSKEYRAEWQKKNKDKRKAADRRWYLKNRDKAINSTKKKYIANKKYYLDWQKENRGKVNGAAKRWRERNPEYSKKWYEKNKDHCHIISKVWRKNNPKIIAEKSRRRIASQLNRIPPWAKRGEIADQVKSIYKNCPAGLTVDHIVPLQGKLVSGLHVPWNLQYLTMEENSRKNNRFEPIVIRSVAS